MVREQMGFSDTLAAIREMNERYPASEILIENKANGAAVVDVLKSEIGHKLRPIEVGTSKTDRAYSVVPQFERGKVWLPNPKLYEWVNPLLIEMQSFPKSVSDDAIDAMTQVLGWEDKRQRTQEQLNRHIMPPVSYSWGYLAQQPESPHKVLTPYEAWKRRQQH